MTELEDWISKACEALGLQADFAFVVDVGDGREIRAVARIRNLGAWRGMLIVRNYDEIRPHTEHLTGAGYGYSVLDDPRIDEAFDLDLFKAMFAEWGWSGSEADRPAALR